MDELAFCGLSSTSMKDIGEMSVSEIMYWHSRVYLWLKSQSQKRNR